ncbi:hypothetical protein [Nonomuraea lactucae]|uniref:hypothetical protein n=1 Tax=Nonomuraea lactucae TaxID=2249762 RepID=UPI0013B3AD1B|nr:hypothetical protein [Nonomuraea lactucae]
MSLFVVGVGATALAVTVWLPQPEGRGRAEYAPPGNEYGSAMVSCLAGMGVQARSIDAGAGIHVTSPRPRSEVEAAVKRCQEATGFDKSPAPLSDREMRSLYASAAEVAECIRRHGHAVPPDPGFRAFAATDAAAWPLYAKVATERLPEVLNACGNPVP